MGEIFKLIGKIAIENDEANKSIDETTGMAKKSEGKISSAFKKIGAAIVTYFAVDKIIAFGKSCVEAAASVRASNSQFEQTFGSMQKEATSAMDKVASASGILKSRLQDTGTSIYAFAKSSGADSAEAMSLMETALQAAADGAAYYDKSLEETGETLKSFLKGNFANDAALGVSATEFTRNAKAAELFGKKYNDLTEIQKQQTLLQMVTDAQKLSGAMGQAAREADGWENVTGNLKESWKQFKAVIGVPILDALIPVVKNLTAGTADLTEKTKAFIDKMSDAKTRSEFFKNAMDSIFSDDMKEAITEYVGGFQAMAERMGNSVFSTFSDKFADIRETFVSLQPVIKSIAEDYIMTLLNRIDIFMAYAEDVAIPILNFLVTVFVDLATTILTAIAPAIQTISSKFAELSQLVSATMHNYIIPALSAFITMMQNLYNENQDKIQLIGELFSTVFNAIADLVVWFVDVFRNYIYPFFGWLSDIVTSNMDNIKAVFQSAFDIIGGIVQFFIALFKGDWTGMWEAVKTILSGAVSFIQNAFHLFASVLAAILEGLWNVIVNIFNSIAESISLKMNEVWNEIVNVWNEIMFFFTEVLTSIYNFFIGIWDSIKGYVLVTVNGTAITIEDVWNGIRNFIVNIMTAIYTTFTTVWNSVRDFINAITSGILTAITSAFENIKGTIFAKLTDAKTSVVTIFTDIRDAINDKIENAKEIVSLGIEKLKSFLKFEWSLPKLKMPHFTINGSFSLNPPSIPSFGVEWYKNGGIMMNPTAFGINGNKLMAGGEAGPEAIAPIDTLQGYVADAVASQNAELVAVLNLILKAIYSMDENLGEKLFNALLNMKFEINDREFARLVKAV